MERLLDTLIRPAFRNPRLDRRHDGARLDVSGPLAFTTDSFDVQPLFFPGGDIGTLAVNGTVNDLAMCGARPLFLSASFILEEGLPLETLRRVVASMRDAAAAAAVEIVTGDLGRRPRQGRPALRQHGRYAVVPNKRSSRRVSARATRSSSAAILPATALPSWQPAKALGRVRPSPAIVRRSPSRCRAGSRPASPCPPTTRGSSPAPWSRSPRRPASVDMDETVVPVRRCPLGLRTPARPVACRQ